jgi:hypothetical protein
MALLQVYAVASLFEFEFIGTTASDPAAFLSL